MKKYFIQKDVVSYSFIRQELPISAKQLYVIQRNFVIQTFL